MDSPEVDDGKKRLGSGKIGCLLCNYGTLVHGSISAELLYSSEQKDF